MITAQLMGGLGNTMFQIAACTALAADNGDICAFVHQTPGMQGSSTTTYTENILNKIKFLGVNELKLEAVYQEPNFHFNKLPYTNNMMLRGYFQSEKYFAHHTEKIREVFKPTPEIKKYVEDKYSFILDRESIMARETIGVHVRRGDYLELLDTHPVCEKDYYDSALGVFKGTSQYDIIFFSDDIEWCKAEFGAGAQYIEGAPDYIDLYLMSMCKHNIIANSSFSWWAAWLNTNPWKIVVAPKKWFGPAVSHDIKDLMPDGWIKK